MNESTIIRQMPWNRRSPSIGLQKKTTGQRLVENPLVVTVSCTLEK